MAHVIQNVDDYIASHPVAVQAILAEIRGLIHAAVPGAIESVRYGMPAVALGDGYRLYFAAWKHHVGMYPIATLTEPLEGEITHYRSGKDTVRFPLHIPIPYPVIERLVAAVAAKHATTEESS